VSPAPGWLPWGAGCAAAGFAAGFAAAFLFNAVPAGWLCDYGETPGPELLGTRLSRKKGGLLLGAVFSAVFFLFHLEYADEPLSFFLLSAASVPLVLAAVSDFKYRIIPDQCLPTAAVSEGVILLYGLFSGKDFFRAAVPPLLGALTGGFLWILVGLLGRALYRRESVGFGDVKLFAAVGFLCGFPEVLFAFCLTVLPAGLHFSILLLSRKIGAKQDMPMAPYICAACLAVLAFRSRIFGAVQWYLSLF
jgi:prepilin signal peptidase PulO-like enzyme (type II secretory pathway)